jgi:nucleotidyltransferase/DNA polymerase involved in DNA repair
VARTPSAIAHLDADCFYVSAERVRNRFLRGKPVGVLGNQGACVIAKSYEMKAAGVKTGIPIWEAVKLCPDGVYVKRDFRWYEVLSRKMLDVVRAFSPRVEYYSIDEFFFEVPSGMAASPQGAAEAIRDHILQAVGVPVTVGVGRTRTLAKLISDTAKPFGAKALLDSDAERSLLERTPVAEVSGVASRRAARLTPHGIATCLDLARADRRRIRDLLTIVGEGLWYELNGDPVFPLHTDRPPHKMLSRGGSLGGAFDDAERLNAWVARNVERLVEELEYHVVHTGALSVYLLHKDGAEGFHRSILPSHTDCFDRLLEAAQDGFRRAWRRRATTRMHITASQLRRPGFVERGLFDPPDQQARAVAAIKREVNARLGRFTLRSGATLALYDSYRDAAQGYDICDVRGKICF